MFTLDHGERREALRDLSLRVDDRWVPGALPVARAACRGRASRRRVCGLPATPERAVRCAVAIVCLRRCTHHTSGAALGRRRRARERHGRRALQSTRGDAHQRYVAGEATRIDGLARAGSRAPACDIAGRPAYLVCRPARIPPAPCCAYQRHWAVTGTACSAHVTIRA